MVKKSLLRRAIVGLLSLVILAGQFGVFVPSSAVAQEATPAPGSAAAASTSVEQQLADLYVPVSYLRQQEYVCAMPAAGGEPYLPLPIDIVLDNPEVLLRDAANDDRVIMSGPGVEDLRQYGEDTYLDYPGDPRRPGCTYETHERKRIEELGLVPTTYAHVLFDEEEGRLALQYWFFYYFNHWNNTHESDWEMIQFMWDDVASVEEALQTEPSRVGFSQHGNGELANWGDKKIKLDDGTHPRIYPAAGSHATFYSPDTFLAWGERNSGFGCDVSNGPSVRTPLKAVLVPDQPAADSEYSWLLYEGRWGERQPSAFNGVVGPAFNSRWIDPWETTDNWRYFSIVVPEVSKTLGPTMTDVFCGLTESGSRLLLFALIHPWVAVLLVAAVAAVLVFFYRRSRGVMARARRMYLSHWRVFIGIGLLAVPIGIAFNIAQAFLVQHPPLEFMVEWLDDTAGAELTAVTAVGGFQQLATLLFIAPAVIQAVADIHRGEKPDVMRSFRLGTARSLPIALAGLTILILALIPSLTLIGIPVAIWLVVRWQFFAQVLVFNHDTTVPDSLRVSSRLVRNRWWKTAFAVFIFDLIAIIPGFVVGFGLLTLGRTAVGFANGASSLLYALAIPFAVIAVTLMYLERQGDPLPS